MTVNRLRDHEPEFDMVQRTFIGFVVLGMGLCVTAVAVRAGAGPVGIVFSFFSPVLFFALCYVVGTLADPGSLFWRRVRRWLDDG